MKLPSIFQINNFRQPGLKFAWKFTGYYLLLSGILHLLLVFYLWGLSQRILMRLANESRTVSLVDVASLSNELTLHAGLISVFVLAVMSGAGIAVCRRFGRVIDALSTDAERFAQGDFRRRIRDTGIGELDRLGRAMNRMAVQLDTRIRTVESQRKEREAIFASMIDGLVAVDLNQRVIHLNDAARKILSLPERGLKGRTLAEVVNCTQIVDLARNVCEFGGSPAQFEVALPNLNTKRYKDGRPTTVQVLGNALLDEDSKPVGAVIVLHDLTEIRKLERVRQDFAANVSHELRTPITSIQGFVETLLEGALTDPRVARRFVEIIGKHAIRLRSVIDDLLSLSRLEVHGDTGEIVKAVVPVSEIVEAVVSNCAQRAKDRQIELAIEGESKEVLSVNRALLEQALINLVDNGISYTDVGGRVSLEIRSYEGGVVFAVRDNGIGIADEHLPRVFERFYRADKARSRNQGGTGLGLSIVKHIVRAHGGSVDVESMLGRGTTFSVSIPHATQSE